MTAKDKFPIGARVRLSELGKERKIGDGKKPFTAGTVLGHGRRGGETMRVLPDGHKNGYSYHMDFWETDDDETTA